MSSRYLVRPAANADIEAIVDYLRQRNPLAAVRFVEAAQATFEYLAEMPRAYPRLGCDDPRLADVRRRPLTGAFHRYLVFYRVTDEDDVDVVRVLHSARDIVRILSSM
jgi:toxin ParE1/3/4